ncbi:MAG TPA: succinate dehydrogenase, hydrophobic membrane anchor protein [Burkholderiales bacterium]|nr:succinate dehydrogenase, hydrophobic membrane anchor protein [Burkholderiales bacterium]
MKAIPGALSAWLAQRLSALYMLLFMLYALGAWLLARPEGYGAWRAWMLAAPIRIPLALFFAALLVHAWVGLRDVIFDYVHPMALRLAALGVVATALALTAIGLAPLVLAP